MDKEAQKYFDGLLQKPITALTPDNIAFLQARQSYLGKKQLAKYAEVLKIKVKAEPKVEDAPAEDPFEEPAPAPKRRSRGKKK